MATISFSILSQRDPSTIYLRFINRKALDVFVKTGIYINPKHWDKKRQRIRNIAEATDKDFINSTLEKLTWYMISRKNIDYTEGIIIDKFWARNTVKDFFNQPQQNKKNFFVQYCQKYIQDIPEKIRKGRSQEISIGTIKRYKMTIQKLKNFESFKGTRLRCIDINLNFHQDFLHYLTKHERLCLNTVGGHIKNIKLFSRNAKLEGYRIHEEIDHPNFFAPSSESKSIYLNDEEINKIFALDLSDNDRLENARDNAIVGLRTGLRVSDFLQLDTDHIKGDFIEVKTKKTGHNVIIPLHPQVKVILEKRKGLPRKISDQKFNLYFKEICRSAGLVEEVEGARMNPTTKRKEEGIFPKYQLVSSHICRRSFATNLYGKLPNLSIMAITGHKTEKQFLEYIKITPREHAEKLKEFWENSVSPD